MWHLGAHLRSEGNNSQQNSDECRILDLGKLFSRYDKIQEDITVVSDF